MNAPASPRADGIEFAPHPTQPDGWLVTVDGDTRTITRNGSGFIAWIGVQFRCWSFQKALEACAEDIRWQASRTVMQPAPLSDEERWLLDYSDAYDASERRARP